MTKPQTSTRVAKLSYKVRGDSTKPALVFLHAFPLHSGQWEEQFEFFAKDFYCVAPDMPGFGGAIRTTDTALTFEAYVEHFRGVLDELKIRSATWIGLSMGGYLALRAYEVFGDRANALVLCDTKAGADGNAAKLKRWDSILSAEKDTAAFIQSQTQSLLGSRAKKNSKILEKFNALVKDTPVKEVQSGLLALATRNDLEESLEKISVPTLVVVGSEDAVTPLKEAQVLVSGIPRSSLAVLDGVGHLSNLEDASAFNLVLKTFLSRPSTQA